MGDCWNFGQSWIDLTGSNGEAMANGRQNSGRQLADVHHDHHTSEQDCQHAQYAEMRTQAGAAVAEDVKELWLSRRVEHDDTVSIVRRMFDLGRTKDMVEKKEDATTRGIGDKVVGAASACGAGQLRLGRMTRSSPGSAILLVA